jgi:16S rRNA (cytidine1402-2'-O)-methyltransferase
MTSQTKHQSDCGQLFVVATPIGNLADMTYRAIETLKEVNSIAAEDTRTSRKLLQHYGIDTPMFALHEHNESTMADALLPRLQGGENIALISDAGTPLISDPGYRLVQKLRAADIRVVPIPGACSIITALSAAGLPTDHFRYAGFLSRSGKTRRTELAEIAASPESTIVLESPRRLLATLGDLETLLEKNRQVCVARELTKLHEEFVNGTADELIAHFERLPPRGEIVVIIEPADKSNEVVDDEQIIACLAGPSMLELPPSARAKAVASTLNVAKSRVYALMIGGND